MLTRDYCVFCKGQINDNEPVQRECASGAIAHERCIPGAKRRAEEKTTQSKLSELLLDIRHSLTRMNGAVAVKLSKTGGTEFWQLELQHLIDRLDTEIKEQK